MRPPVGGLPAIAPAWNCYIQKDEHDASQSCFHWEVAEAEDEATALAATRKARVNSISLCSGSAVAAHGNGTPEES